MRVSDSMTFDLAQRNIAASLEKQTNATEAESSGLRVEHPGDDPAASGLIAGATVAQARYSAIGTAVGRASDELDTATSTLGSLSDVLSRAQELATQLSNSTYSATDRAAGAQEVGSLLQQAVALGNTQVGNRYIFGGTADSSAPFDSTGNFSGNAQARQVEVAPGVMQNVSVDASSVFKGAGGGQDVFAAISGLQTALTSNNLAGIQSSLTSISGAISQVAVARSQVGGDQSVLDASSSASQLAVQAQKTSISHLGDVDAFQAATDLQAAQNALNATLTATSMGFQLSLVDKLSAA